MKTPHIVIIGGGFGGLAAARRLGKKGLRVTLLDKRNFQLFQPLLYQVATGMLPTGDIAIPLRAVLRKFQSVTVLQATALDIDPVRRVITHEHGMLAYDRLIVASGVKHHYFGHDDWGAFAPGLKTIEHALTIRRKLLSAFERAEITEDAAERDTCLRFVVVGAGPTGVELAGAIAELAHKTMPGEFRRIDTRKAEVILLEGGKSVLPVYPEKLREAAKRHLESLGVTVHTQALVKDVNAQGVVVEMAGVAQQIDAQNVLWAAGVRASAFGEKLGQRCGVIADRAGRLPVTANCSLATHPDIFVIGDLAAMKDAKGYDVPGLAQAAQQEGDYVADVIVRAGQGKPAPKPFAYRNLGSMAVIGTHRAVGDLPFMKVTGAIGWYLWAFVHVMSLIEGRQRMRVFITWAWRYFTRQVGDRLITGNPAKTRSLQAALEEAREESASA